MIYRRGQKVLVQGMTGKQGSFWTEKMREMGTDVVAGVNPKPCRRDPSRSAGLQDRGRGGEVYIHRCIGDLHSADHGEGSHDSTQSDAGIGTIVALTEHIPGHDVLEIFARLKNSNSRIIGPNTAGIVTPGEGFVGMPRPQPEYLHVRQCGCHIEKCSLGTLMCLNLTRARLGQSAFIGIGGDPIIGTTDARCAY